MIKQEEWVMIKNLERQGVNKTEIGKMKWMNRKTIAKQLKKEKTPKYTRKKGQ